MKHFIFIVLLFVSSTVFGSHKIMLLHCYACPRMVMDRIEKSCNNEHFITENYGYKSLYENLDTLGRELYLNINKSDFDTISFVTHSMGALVVRSMLQFSQKDKNFPVIFRMVMIAPPNHGSEMADFGSSIEIIKYIGGPNVLLMKTDSSSYTNNLPIPYKSEVGIIVGSLVPNRGYNPFIKGDNDGLVTPEETKLGIEKDIAVVSGFHGLLPQQKIVCKLVIDFLKSGTFLAKKNQVRSRISFRN